MRYDIAIGDSFCSYEFPPTFSWFSFLVCLFVGVTIRNPAQTMNGILSYTVKTGDKKLLAFVQFSRGTSVLNQPVMGVYSMWKSWSAIKDLKSSLMSIEMNNMPQMPLHVKYEASFWHLQMGQKWNEILAATLQPWKGTGWISDNNCSPEASR